MTGDQGGSAAGATGSSDDGKRLRRRRSTPYDRPPIRAADTPRRLSRVVRRLPDAPLSDPSIAGSADAPQPILSGDHPLLRRSPRLRSPSSAPSSTPLTRPVFDPPPPLTRPVFDPPPPLTRPVFDPPLPITGPKLGLFNVDAPVFKSHKAQDTPLTTEAPTKSKRSYLSGPPSPEGPPGGGVGFSGTCIWGTILPDFTGFGMESRMTYDTHCEDDEMKGHQITKNMYLLSSGVLPVSIIVQGIVMRHVDFREQNGLPVTAAGILQALHEDTDFNALRLTSVAADPENFNAVCLLVQVGVAVWKIIAGIRGIFSQEFYNMGAGSGWDLAGLELRYDHLLDGSSFVDMLQAVERGFRLAAIHDEYCGGDCRAYVVFHDGVTPRIQHVFRLPPYERPWP